MFSSLYRPPPASNCSGKKLRAKQNRLVASDKYVNIPGAPAK